MENKYVMIEVSELQNLLEAREELAALECAGVDNWEFYGEAFSNYLDFDGKYEDWDDFIEGEFNDEDIMTHYGEVK